MLLGLRTAIYHTPDITAGKQWYTRVLDIAPYFDQPFYVGFNVGGFELGLSPDAGPDGRCSVGAYWGVKDIVAAHSRLLELGAAPRIPGGMWSASSRTRISDCLSRTGPLRRVSMKRASGSFVVSMQPLANGEVSADPMFGR